MRQTLTDAIAESMQENRSVEVEVEDVDATYLDLLASAYEVDSDDWSGSIEAHGDRRVLRVWGWRDETPDGEAEWTLTLVQSA